MIYDCLWPGCDVGDLAHERMCCSFHFTRLPKEMQLRMLFPNAPDEEWAELIDEIQKWALEVGLCPKVSRLCELLRENAMQRLIHTRLAVAENALAWLEQMK